jgi:hypothetical protein
MMALHYDLSRLDSAEGQQGAHETWKITRLVFMLTASPRIEGSYD